MSREPAPLADEVVPAPQTRNEAAVRSWLPEAVAFALLLLITIAAQAFEQGYSRPMGSYEDEPAHFLSALMVRDYVMAGMPDLPWEYAELYYNRHPAIAIGYWPPLYYVLAGFWMIVFGFSRTSLLLFAALVCAVLQYAMFRFASREFGRSPAFVVAAIFGCVPVVARANTLVMTDVLLALMGFAATLSFGRYFSVPTMKNALIFGGLAAAAMLTKASAIWILALPPISILLARRWDAIARWPFWIWPLVVAAIYSPWHFLSRHLTSRGLLPATVEMSFVDNLIEYLSAVLRLGGALVLIPAVIGGVLIAMRPVRPVWYAIAAQPLCVGILLTLAPVRLEARYLIMALPCVMLLATYALRVMLPQRYGGMWFSLLVAPVLASMLLATSYQPPAISPELGAAADYISREAGPDDVILVSSAHGKEVLMVAELAAREPHRPGRFILRGNKVLAETDWNSTWYRLRYRTPEAVLAHLEERSADWILVGTPEGNGSSIPHHQLLLEAVEGAGARWRLVQGGERYQVYRGLRD